MKSKKFALLLPILPLLMANSAVSRPYSKYEDYDASFVRQEVIDNYRYQVFNLKNTGNSYIMEFYVYGQNDYEYSAYFYESSFNPLFESTVIAPNQEVEIKIKGSTPVDVIDGNKLTYTVYAYTQLVEDAEVTGTKTVTLKYERETYCYYSIDMALNNVDKSESYSVVLKAVYDGQEVYLKVDSTDRFCFYTSELIDLTKLEIKGVSGVLSNSTTRYSDDYSFLGAFGGVFLTLFIIFLAVIFTVGSLIFLLVFLPKIIRHSKAKKRAKESN